MSAERRVPWLIGWIAVTAVLTGPWTSLTGHAHWAKVAWLPFTGIVRWYDLVGNVALYLPLGILLSRRGRGCRLTEVAPPVVAALLLSAALELSQVWSHARFPSATDVLCNVVGALVGACWHLRAKPATASADSEVGKLAD